MCLELAGAGRDKRCGRGLGIGTVCAARKDANRGNADWVGRTTQVLLQAKLADVDMLSGNDRRARAVLCLWVGLAHHALRVVSQGATDVGRGGGVLAGRCLVQRVCTVHSICTRRALPAQRCTLLVEIAEHRNIILVGIMGRRKRRLGVAAILHAAWSMRVHACGSSSTRGRCLTYQELTKIEPASTTNFAQPPKCSCKITTLKNSKKTLKRTKKSIFVIFSI